MLMGQRTVVGIDVSPAIETGNVHLVLGYKRRTAAFVPTAQVGTDAMGRPDREAMSVVAFSAVGVSFWRLPEIAECFATGEAAVQIAGSKAAVESLRCDIDTNGDSEEGGN